MCVILNSYYLLLSAFFGNTKKGLLITKCKHSVVPFTNPVN